MDQAAEPVEVLLHVVGIDQELVDQAREPVQREIQRHRRVGPIMRSAEECEMSRSCQSTTFSIAGVT